MADKKLFPNLKKAETAAAVPPKQEEKGNVFTNLFEDNGKKKTGTDSVVESVMKKTDTKSILGPKPKTYNVGHTEKRPVHFASGFLKVVVYLWLLMLVGSYLTMWAGFDLGGLNQSVKADENLTSLKTEQAKLNSENYLIAYYYLDNFAYNADVYTNKQSIYNSSYTTSAEKKILEGEIADLESVMKSDLEIIQEKLSQPIVPDGITPRTELGAEVEFKEATSAYLENEIASLKTGETAEDSDINLEINGLNGALALVKNGAFVKELMAIDSSETFDTESISTILEGLNSIISDNFTLISSIKNKRLSWGPVIQEIEAITKEVDPLYGSAIASDINYASYSLNSESKTITLQGTTVTDDARNFTLIADLIDALEQSSMFMDIKNRSFSKNDSANEDDTEYESSFRLEFKLQEGEDSRDKQFSIDEITTEEDEEVKIPVETTVATE